MRQDSQPALRLRALLFIGGDISTNMRASNYSDIPQMPIETLNCSPSPPKKRSAHMSLDDNQTPTVDRAREHYKVVGFADPPPKPALTTSQLPVGPVEKPIEETPKPRRNRTRKTPSVAVYLKLPADLAKSLRLMAMAEDTTQSSIAEQALRDHVGEWVLPYRKNKSAA